MHNPYIQVAMTYIRRLLTRGNLLFLFFACSMLLLEVISRGAHAVAIPSLFAVFVCFGLMIHMVEQFASWRAHLLPNYRRAHAIVAANLRAINDGRRTIASLHDSNTREAACAYCHRLVPIGCGKLRPRVEQQDVQRAQGHIQRITYMINDVLCAQCYEKTPIKSTPKVKGKVKVKE